jgi:endoglycosylceramidase
VRREVSHRARREAQLVFAKRRVIGAAAGGLALALVAGFGSVAVGAASPHLGGSELGHEGRWVTDADGRVVILHGLNMVNKRAPYTPAAAGFGAAAASTLATNGFDVVRLGVLYQAVEPKPGVIDHQYLRAIAATVAQLASHGVYTLLDFHQDELNQEFGGEGFPTWSVQTNGLAVKKYVFPLAYLQSRALGRAFDNYWSNKRGPGAVGLQQRYVAALVAVARQFSTDPWVIGYDLFNEPWPADATTSQLAAFYARAILGIRSVDADHLIWYEPWVTFNFGVQTGLGTFEDHRLGMSFHDYCLNTAAASCPASEERTVTNALAHASSTGVALLLTEFGATDNYADLGRVVSAADASQVSWIEWSYCGCNDPTGTIPPRVEALVYRPGSPGSGSNVNEAKLKVLAEPYPRLVAGTPLSFHFDAATKTFELTYRTQAPNGHQFGTGACTAVEIPAVQYPTGYQVQVVGGQVLSKPDAGVLSVGASSGAATVSVTVVPTQQGTTGPGGPVPASCGG